MDAQSLLAGPRGRRLLQTVRDGADDALAWTVAVAHYWQPPDADDLRLELPSSRAELASVAEAVAASSRASWWAEPVDRSCQYIVRFLTPGFDEPSISSDFPGRLGQWHANAIAGENDAEDRDAPLSSLPSRAWWSTPAFTGLPITTRALPVGGPVRLAHVEDSLGWADALVTAVDIAPAARVFEIAGAADWIELVERYPMDATRSRRACWFWATGIDDRWVIPGWLAVARDFDAVHLSVAGYLATAGRALPVSDGNTMLAGFSPDETYWLADVVRQSGPPQRWHRDRGVAGWAPAVDVL